MDVWAVSAMVAGVVFVSGIAGFNLHRVLPEHHLFQGNARRHPARRRDAVGVGIAVFTADRYREDTVRQHPRRLVRHVQTSPCWTRHCATMATGH